MKKVNLLYFSATGTTERIVREIGVASGYDINKVVNLAVTPSTEINLTDTDLCIIGMPVYAGRIPEIASRHFKDIKAAGTPAIILAVYGNRAWEDALIELNDLSTASGFSIIAAGAFIGEHSFSTPEFQVAHKRPDSEDLQNARQFVKDALRKLERAIISSPEIPGSFPYKKGWSAQEIISPETNPDECIGCGICIDSCPTSAISIQENKILTDKEKCMWCTACVKRCPTHARDWNSDLIEFFRNRLVTNCSERKEPEFFL